MKLPHRFGKYLLIEKIASGGMAEVYRAKYLGEEGFAKEVAIKRLLPTWSACKDFERMLIDEARALVHLQHQNIVQVFELGKDGDCYFISMEYVDGTDLRHIEEVLWGEGRRMPYRFSCFIISEVLKGLEFAHRMAGGIIHRDISPQNILISKNGEVKLADFGIAKGFHRSKETTSGHLKGKLAYMSPEQAMAKRIDVRSDLYSLGVVFLELIIGREVYKGLSEYEVLKMVADGMLPYGWEKETPLGLRKILKMALSPDPSGRYTSAAEFLKDLNRHILLKGLHATSIDLAGYLRYSIKGDWRREKIKDGKGGEGTVKTPLFHHETERGKGYVLRLTSLSLSLAAIVSSASMSMGGGDSLYIANRLPATPSVKSTETPTPPPLLAPLASPTPPAQTLKGMVEIESVPSGAKGVLRCPNGAEDFTTPFVRSDIDITKEAVCTLSIKMAGYEPVEEKISISALNPTYSKRYELKAALPPSISVHARPWGYVEIPGVLGRRESPVSNVTLGPGMHEIRVSYPPKKMAARTNLKIENGKRYSCAVDFEKGGGLVCR